MKHMTAGILHKYQQLSLISAQVFANTFLFFLRDLLDNRSDIKDSLDKSNNYTFNNIYAYIKLPMSFCGGKE